ncbi:MAG: biotin-dependent carboxyltransferase family protein [Verrucomicrobiales bacterium]|nr:biotin-dependent carboxyltransferase family protein [Verrucomicrobiales bacterium]
MSVPLMELVDHGLGLSLQDLGRRGWKRFGVPPGGALDDHAARWANRLLDNPTNAPVLEILMHGVTLRALRRVTVAVTGAAPHVLKAGRGGPWHTAVIEPHQEITITPPQSGLWTYLAVAGGGFAAPRWFGSVSIFPRGGLGESLGPGFVLAGSEAATPRPDSPIGERWVDPSEIRNYARPPALRVWPGPQFDLFSTAARAAFFEQPWRVSSRSDRTGYRLDGAPIPSPALTLPSEPVLPGSIQVPPDGLPIVTMRDGPTVGGYSKIGLIDPEALAWLAQCRPGQQVRLELILGPSHPE